MRLPPVLCVGFSLIVGAHLAWAEDPRVVFDNAVRSELFGGEEASRTALELYLRAARAGLTEAEFNVAVLLDSGRGVKRDAALAATWYARAAAHGNERAAYNLGQLYDSGDGVPRNPDLARAWFLASNVPAALARAARPAGLSPKAVTMEPPTAIFPRADLVNGNDTGLTEFVWTSPQQVEPAQFLLEICALDKNGARELFSGVTRLSSLSVILPRDQPFFAWRVSTILPKSAQYATSHWMYFGPDPHSQSASQ